MYDAIDQYGGVDSNNDALTLFSAEDGDNVASVASSQQDYHVNLSWQDQVYGALGVIKEEAEKTCVLSPQAPPFSNPTSIFHLLFLDHFSPTLVQHQCHDVHHVSILPVDW